MKKYLTYGCVFELLPKADLTLVQIKRVEAEEINSDTQSLICNAEIAEDVSKVLGRELVYKAECIIMAQSDILYAARPCKSSEGVGFEFFEVTIKRDA